MVKRSGIERIKGNNLMEEWKSINQKYPLRPLHQLVSRDVASVSSTSELETKVQKIMHPFVKGLSPVSVDTGSKCRYCKSKNVSESTQSGGGHDEQFKTTIVCRDCRKVSFSE
jgi:hypothetical protein